MEERDDIFNSSSSLNHDSTLRIGVENFKSIYINQAKKIIKDFSELDNLNGFKQLVENFEIELSEEILIKAFKLLKRVYYSPVVLSYEISEQLYKHLSNFVDFHYRMTNAFKQGVGNSFNMRDDETRIDEILRHIKDFLLAFIHISSKAAEAVSGNISGALDIAQAFKFKYPITYWYPIWRELLSIQYLLGNLAKDDNYNKLRFYNETYLLELLWQCIFDLKPTTPPNSLWFGILDLAQHLSQKTTQVVSLALCYYLALESLQNSKCNYICFKSLELLLSLSYQKPELFNEIVKDDINKYKESLSTTSQQIFEKIIHDVNQKLQLNLKFMNQLNVTEELTCPITKQITGDFLILTCRHSISCYAINKWKEVITIENRLFKCPFCKNEIELNSTYNFPKNKILEKDDLFLKFNKNKIFQNFMLSKLSAPIFQKIQPKLTQVLKLHPKSYSIRCRRAFASYKLKMYSKAKDDLDKPDIS
ncbi:11799_t:CDS:2 [Dentiscutata erythropus]|uniref:11799_t:CDS:1 n=1 Tax=Dentiscutata erythropus TaxID=1348616 RepID=A0A9N9HQ73_9GLOM|nr:11799_t:CDS:2 [Dentiscutata erythropus]